MSQRSLAEDVGLALATVSNFLTGKPVDRATFVELCDRLSIEVESIAALAQEPPKHETNRFKPAVIAPLPPQHSTQPSVDWGESLDVSTFYGRHEELTTLTQWIVEDRCRLVMLVGMGGIGKTALSVKLAEQIQGEFEFVIWRSLRNAPPIQTLLTELIQFLSHQQSTNLPETVDGQVSCLMHYIRQARCLIVLDNLESVLGGDDRAGAYREGYENYGHLLRCIGESNHLSCFVLTSREQPRELHIRKGIDSPIRALRLPGLTDEQVKAIFHEKGLTVSTEESQILTQHYAGNPLALKIVATTIEELFDGNIAHFLSRGTVVFGDIVDLLNQQFNRLTPLEQQVMYWLAIHRDWMSIAELENDIVPKIKARSLLEALESLQLRSLIEKNASSFTQQPVVMEYVTEHFIEQICSEIVAAYDTTCITDQSIALFNTHALIKAQTKDYLRSAQIRCILNPIAEQLFTLLGNQDCVRAKLLQLLEGLRSHFKQRPGYAAGNLLNLFSHLHLETTGLDFSQLVLWQAYLQNVNLHRVNFANADLSQSVFTQTLGGVLSATFSPNGSQLATGTDQAVCLWQVTDSRPLKTLKGHQGWVQTVAFSADGTILASGSNDQTIKLWNAETGQCLKTLRGHSSWVQTVAFSADGTILASGSNDHTIKLWNIQTGQGVSTLEGHRDRILSVMFSSDRTTLISSSDDQTIKQWNIQTGQCLRSLDTPINWVRAIALSPDGKTLVTGSYGTTVNFWDLETGQCVRVLPDYTSQVWAIAFSPDGQTLATGSEDQTVKLWDVVTGRCLQTFQEHQHRVWLVEFSPDGNTLLSISEDQTTKFWDLKAGQCLRTLEAYSNWVLSIAFSPDGQLLASSSQDQQIRVWNIATGQCVNTLIGHTHLVSAIAFPPQSEHVQWLASGSDDHTIKIWNWQTGECANTFWGHESWVQSLSFSADGKRLVSGSRDRTLKLWDVETGECLYTLKGHAHRVKAVAFNWEKDPTNQRIASGSDDHTIKIWDVETGVCIQTLEGHQDWVLSVHFSSCGRRLVSGSGDRTVKLWDISTGQCLHSFEGHTHRVRSVVFSPDGNWIASAGDDQTIFLWNASTGETFNKLQGHQKTIWSIAFSPDSQWLASGSSDETIRLWSTQPGACVQILRADRPYEGMNIHHASGLTSVQKATLKALGAIEDDPLC